MRRPALILASLSALALAACAPQAGRLGAAPPAPGTPDWAFARSDVPVDPAFRFGRLANGMRYVVRRNATPQGTALVRMEVAAGSLDESDAERGFAHFVEHMAFNGSTNVPEGEMVRLLEREGLSFGADTNAQTGFERTTYLLDLPRNDPALLDTALMLMRETASELTITPEAVERERGVLLAEMRDRNTWRLRNLQAQISFLDPDARYTRRMPIGTAETLQAATADTLRAFWQREYVPAQTTLIVVGDFDAAAVESAIAARFAGWQPALAEPQPDPGPFDPRHRGQTGIHIDPALSERVTASRHGRWLEEPDTLAQRRENLLRQVGYGIVNRRLQSLSRTDDAPFRGAGFGTSESFRRARTTNLVVDVVDGKWRRGLLAAVAEYRTALRFGFTAQEVAEQVANIRAVAQNAAGSASTRPHGELVNAVFALLHDQTVPAEPEGVFARLEAFLPEITPDAAMAALRREAVPLDKPLLRFQGRMEPQGGASAIRAAWDAAMRAPIARRDAAAGGGFTYQDFGPAGTITSDTREPGLGIRQLRFANGVRLNLRRTDLERDKAMVQVSIDGGDFLATRENPLASQMVSALPAGGLGRHSQDELQSMLAGRTVERTFESTPETFVARARTTPRDLELQLQLFAAFVTDPGYRREGEVLFRQNINTYFASYRATPGGALEAAMGGILSANDPRFTLQPADAYRALTFARLRSDITDRLANGAIEIGIVGDVDEDAAIAMVARTFGALPAREADFGAHADQRQRPFTSDRGPHIVHHAGDADQAVVRLTWLTRDDSNAEEKQALNLLERIVQIALTETLRERLGKAYSPGAQSEPTRTWPGYGTFTVTASVAVSEVAATRAAILEVIAALREASVAEDVLQRARQPLAETFDNALKTNRGWMALVDRAQTEADMIDRQLNARARLMAVTPDQVRDLARRYLTAEGAVQVIALPDGVDEAPALR